MAGVVKAAAGEAQAGALTAADSCATLRSPELLLFPCDDDEFGRYIGFHESSQRVLAEDCPPSLHSFMKLYEHRAHEPKQEIVIGEYANHFGSPLQFLRQRRSLFPFPRQTEQSRSFGCLL